MGTKVYITRHGETLWNIEGRMQGWKDSALTEKGIKQAEALRPCYNKRYKNPFCEIFRKKKNDGFKVCS